MDNDNLPANTGSSAVNPIKAASNIMGARLTALKPIQYSARVTRKNPAAIILMIDQSASMSDLITNGYGITKPKSQALAEVVNELFESLLMKCLKDELYRDYFNFLVIGYGNEFDDSNVSIVWEGNLQGSIWVNVNDLASNLLRKDSVVKKQTMPWGEIKESIVTRKVWINPSDDGSCTPMLEAFKLCKQKVEEWVESHKESFPPLVFNITDGKPTDVDNIEDLVEICNEIKMISTNDGATLLFNCLLPDANNLEVILPADFERQLLESEEYHLALFDATSYLPKNMRMAAYESFDKNEKYLENEVKGVIINSSISSLVKLLNIGTNTTESNDRLSINGV
ncbi:hypothetical protein HXX01_00070 [Candidatus Nomurabacteria bacterium]|nr:hypothetical protein [Candidatus Nomurabacteria bacterium]